VRSGLGVTASDGMMGAEGSQVLRIRRPARGRGERLVIAACLWPAIVILAVGLAACGHAAAGTGKAAKAQQCGTSRTAANVPITVQVNSSQVSCSAVLAVEKAYASDIREGKVPGNGGGAPVNVNGWTCQGFPTPEVLKTGNASRCIKGRMEILAILSTTS
jgi:hypothetical protein